MGFCRINKKKLRDIISFGKMPIANNFLDKYADFKKEYFFELALSFSDELSLVQLD